MAEMRTLLDAARDIARDAHEQNFSIRRMTGSIDDAIYLADNNPYQNDAGQREREHAALKLNLAVYGLDVATVARYPLGCDEWPEYTVVIVFELGPRFEGTVSDAKELLRGAWENLLSERDRFHGIVAVHPPVGDE